MRSRSWCGHMPGGGGTAPPWRVVEFRSIALRTTLYHLIARHLDSHCGRVEPNRPQRPDTLMDEDPPISDAGAAARARDSASQEVSRASKAMADAVAGLGRCCRHQWLERRLAAPCKERRPRVGRRRRGIAMSVVPTRPAPRPSRGRGAQASADAPHLTGDPEPVLQAVELLAAESGVRCRTELVASRNPADPIAAEAVSMRVGLVVMGTGRRGSLRAARKVTVAAIPRAPGRLRRSGGA